MRLRFTETQIKKALKDMVILVDTREKKTDHILKWFDDHKIKYKITTVKFGDYSAMIPAGSLTEYDIYFDRDVVVERKANIDELAINCTKDRPRLKAEFAHLNKYNTSFYLLIEDPFFDENIRSNNFKSSINGNTLFQNIKGLESAYNTKLRPIDKKFSGSEIVHSLEKEIRNILLRNFDITRDWGEF